MVSHSIVAEDFIGIDEFLRSYPSMGLRPSADIRLRFKGRFAFTAEHDTLGEVKNAFQLEIDVPDNFPKELPVVREVGGRIPQVEAYHVNPDKSLCLGSPLSLLWRVHQSPTLSGFAEDCIVPYLFAVSRKLETGEKLVFGELDHGDKGRLADYRLIFGLKSNHAVVESLRLLGMKKRLANKYPCPCGCGKRLGVCRFNRRLAEFRRIAGRSWFRREFVGLLKQR